MELPVLKPVLLILAGFGVILGLSTAYTRWQSLRIADRYPPAGIFVTTDGVRVHFTDRKPDRPAKAVVLLIHGASGNEREMRLALGEQLLARQYRVISVDRPGLGWSDRPDNLSADPSVQARLIHNALMKHGVERVIAVAHSLGGSIAMQLALDHSSMVQGAVLLSPATHPWPGGIATYYSVAASPFGPMFNNTLALPAGQILMRPALESVFSPQSPPPEYVERTGIALALRPDVFANNARDVAGLYDFVSTQAPRYRNISIPLAVVSGSADTVVLTDIHSRSIVREVPDATLKVLPGVGHAPHWVRPDAVLAAVDQVHDRVTVRQTQSAR